MLAGKVPLCKNNFTFPISAFLFKSPFFGEFQFYPFIFSGSLDDRLSLRESGKDFAFPLNHV
jgi:hypothetical protein